MIGFIYAQTHDSAQATLRLETRASANELLTVGRREGLRALVQAIEDDNANATPESVAALLDGGGRVITGNLDQTATPLVRLREGEQEVSLRRSGDTSFRRTFVWLRRVDGGHWLLSGRLADSGLALSQTLERSLAIGVALALALGLLVGWFLSGFVDRKVEQIAAVTSSFGAGQFDARVQGEAGSDAFAHLARQTNGMLDRIAGLMTELQMLTDSLAHDLRSPVSRLRAAAEQALQASDLDSARQQLGNVIRQADALMRILSTVLEIGRSEALTTRNQFAAFDPGELIAELAEMYEPVAEDRGFRLSLGPGWTGGSVLGHRQLLAQALSNLIDNALRYSGPGGEIRLEAEADGDELRLGVVDRGPGIPLERREEARRRFGRLDPSRSSDGAGLGLTLVEAIAHLHGGRLHLADAAPGLLAELRLPLK